MATTETQPRFPSLLLWSGAALAGLWIVLTAVSLFIPTPGIRILPALLASGVLLGGAVWYCLARWATHSGRSTSSQLRLPILLCAGAWLFCLGSALTPASARKEESSNPTPALAQRNIPRSKLFPDGERRFLSELEEFDVVNGKWPFTKGETGDGHVIKVGGRKSPHGLGMHPPWAPKFASVKYKLGMEAALFKATVAIDDSSNWCWSPATFTVWGDGRELWRSKGLGPNDPDRRQECQVNVKHVNILELRVEVLNGSDGDHAVWFEPRILQAVDSPDPGMTFEPFKNGPREFLSDMPENVIKQGERRFTKNGELDEGRSKIKVRGVLSPKGLNMHPPDNGYMAVSYRLDRKATVFKASVALDDKSQQPRNPAVFEVLGDGKSLWESQPINKGTPPEEISIDVSGVVELELRVHAKPSHFDLWAVWIEPRLLQSADTPDK
jgi:hypothetical protein